MHWSCSSSVFNKAHYAVTASLSCEAVDFSTLGILRLCAIMLLVTCSVCYTLKLMSVLCAYVRLNITPTHEQTFQTLSLHANPCSLLLLLAAFDQLC
jgi:hypothetical protein